MILESRRFATVTSSGMECSWKLAGGGELLRQLVIQCDSFQVPPHFFWIDCPKHWLHGSGCVGFMAH